MDDHDFTEICEAIRQGHSRAALSLKQYKVHIYRWLERLQLSAGSKKTRSEYARLLLFQVQSHRISEPFSSMPPDGGLPSFPAHLRSALRSAMATSKALEVADPIEQDQRSFPIESSAAPVISSEGGVIEHDRRYIPLGVDLVKIGRPSDGNSGSAQGAQDVTLMMTTNKSAELEREITALRLEVTKQSGQIRQLMALAESQQQAMEEQGEVFRRELTSIRSVFEGLGSLKGLLQRRENASGGVETLIQQAIDRAESAAATEEEKEENVADRASAFGDSFAFSPHSPSRGGGARTGAAWAGARSPLALSPHSPPRGRGRGIEGTGSLLAGAHSPQPALGRAPHAALEGQVRSAARPIASYEFLERSTRSDLPLGSTYSSPWLATRGLL